MVLVLHGYEYSVYSWIARLVLREKNVVHDYIEVDPFSPAMPIEYLRLNPFRRVPTLIHDDFVLYETAAIARYVDETFPGKSLQPTNNRDRARVAQIVGVIDAYGYWPMVRQVFAHGFFRPLTGRDADPDEVATGLIESDRLAANLESLAGDGGYLVGHSLTLADLHLAPMIAYLTTVPAGRAQLGQRPKLLAWWGMVRCRPAFIETQPRFPAADV